MVNVRPYISTDRAFVLSLAPRLAIGKQPWRDLTLWVKTVEEWLTESINQHSQNTMVLIAEDEEGERLGFATVSHSAHFTGRYLQTLRHCRIMISWNSLKPPRSPSMCTIICLKMNISVCKVS